MLALNISLQAQEVSNGNSSQTSHQTNDARTPAIVDEVLTQKQQYRAAAWNAIPRHTFSQIPNYIICNIGNLSFSGYKL
ncbi:MAG: hypothetical protein V7749_13490 [Cocleimonas sp.]